MKIVICFLICYTKIKKQKENSSVKYGDCSQLNQCPWQKEDSLCGVLVGPHVGIFLRGP